MEEKEKPRLSRLTAIITQLQSKRIVTPKYLAERHKVSVRTIYRDIRTLEKSGTPIVTEEGKGYCCQWTSTRPMTLQEEFWNPSFLLVKLIIYRIKN